MDKRMEPEVLLEHRSFLRNLAWSLLHDEKAAEDVAADHLLHLRLLGAFGGPPLRSVGLLFSDRP